MTNDFQVYSRPLTVAPWPLPAAFNAFPPKVLSPSVGVLYPNLPLSSHTTDIYQFHRQKC